MLSSQLKFSVLLVALLLVAGCAPRMTQDGAVRGRLPELQPPVVAAVSSGAVINSFDPPGAGARLLVQVPVTISNPNPFGLTVSGAELRYRIGAGGSSQLLADSLSSLEVPANSTITHTFELNRGLRQDTDLLLQAAAAFSGEGLPVAIAGTYQFSSEHHPWLTGAQLNLTVRAGAAASVELPQLAVIASESSVYSLTDDAPVVRVVIEARNPGGVGYLLHAKDVLLLLGGEPIAVHDLPPTPVPARSSTRVALNFEPVLPVLSPASRSALSDALAGAQTELALEGQFALDVLGLDTWLLPADLQLGAVIQAD